MNYSVTIGPEADEEFFNAKDYYLGIGDELGDDICASIAECIERISDNPELYATVYGKIRPVTLRRFPFILSYVFENEQIVVVGLVHANLPHEIWKGEIDFGASPVRDLSTHQ